MNLSVINKANYIVLASCFALSVFAMVFYWSRDWIHFNASAVLWVLYPLVPYTIIGGIGYFINRRKKHIPTAVVLLLGSMLLLGLTIWFYVPFLDSTLIFYLRMSLGMSGLWLGLVAVFFIVASFLVGLSAKSKTPFNKALKEVDANRGDP